MSSSNMIVLKSSDGKTFEVEVAVALESQKIKVMIEEDRFDSHLPDVTTKTLSIGDVTSKILSMVIEYCKKHVDTPAEDLKSFDSDLVKVDQGTLFDLILAANSLEIKSLLDVAYEAVGDMIKGKTAEEIRMTFNIKNGFTPEVLNYGQKQVSLGDLQTSKTMRMPEYIVSPSHQEEIMIRLPVASVLECRKVSKAWKSLIDRPQFITAHSHHRRTHSRLLLLSNVMIEEEDLMSEDVVGDYDVRFLSIRDDGTFPDQQSNLSVPFPIGELYHLTVCGSSHGLICLRGIVRKPCRFLAVLWNPSIGKTVVVPFPQPQDPQSLGFGVCPVTGDPKLLSVSFDYKFARVFTLSSRKWRSITMPTDVRSWSPTTTDKFIYSFTDFDNQKLVSFDLTRETFQTTYLRGDVTSFRYTCKIWDSFAVVVPTKMRTHSGLESCHVWILKDDGAQKSFTILSNILCVPKCDWIRGSTADGMFIVLRQNPDDPDEHYAAPGSKRPNIDAYAPETGEYYPLGIDKVWHDITVEPYEQTLLLLDCDETGFAGRPGDWDHLSFV